MTSSTTDLNPTPSSSPGEPIFILLPRCCHVALRLLRSPHIRHRALDDRSEPACTYSRCLHNSDHTRREKKLIFPIFPSSRLVMSLRSWQVVVCCVVSHDVICMRKSTLLFFHVKGTEYLGSMYSAVRCTSRREAHRQCTHTV